MKITRAALFFVLFFIAFLNISAQSFKLIEGDAGFLKNEKSVSIEFTYENMQVGKYKKEQDFVDFKKADLNKKEAGKGDTWAVKWVDDRSYKFQPKFIEAFTNNSSITFDSTKNAKYTIIFNTSFIEPGFSAGWPIRKNAEINGEAIIVESTNRSKVLAKISIEKVPGNSYGGFDFDTGSRIMGAYQKAGQALAKFIQGK